MIARSMNLLLNHPWVFGSIVALVLAGVSDAGRRIESYYRIQDNPYHKDQLVAIRDGLFVLVSLLLGFTLAFVVPRYAERRSLLIEDANAIGTTYLRAGTLPPSIRNNAQQLLRQYVDARLDLDNADANESRASATARAKQIQALLWQGVVELTASDRSAVSAAYMNSLNQLIDLHEKRASASEHRVPYGVWLLILSVAAMAFFTRGLTVERQFWLTLVLLPVTIAIVIALIADLDTPNAGIIRVDQRAMQRLKADIAVPN